MFVRKESTLVFNCLFDQSNSALDIKTDNVNGAVTRPLLEEIIYGFEVVTGSSKLGADSRIR